MTSVISSIRRGLVLLVAATAMVAAGPALSQDKIGAKVGKPMKAAQEAIEKKQWDQALARIAEADAVAGKSAFEQYQINEFKGYVLLQQRKYGEVARVYEQNLDSGKLPPEQVDDRLKALVQLNTAVKNYPKVTQLGERWIKAGGQDVETRVLIGQAHYLQKDYKNAVSVMQGAIRSTEQAGGRVDENWLQLVRSAQQNLGDTEGATATLEKLVRLYPKAEYWDYLLSLRMRQKNTDRVQLNLLRVARQVGVLNNAEEYVEMTEMLLEVGLPGEARSVMEAGYQAKAFETTDKTRADRYKRRYDDAKAAAARDQQSLPAIERDAQKAPTGQGDVALGLAYGSFGQYEKAVAALSNGLKKGGVRDVDQAQIMLGIANLELDRKSDAIKAFEEVKADPQMTDVARLWIIVARSGAG
ncbi:MAG: tetratricopeptide repeat protein [Gammaproteobacteria bacterium]|nr:tetratricopeptide repeat protein [Gammaproteobacteria bacterium]